MTKREKTASELWGEASFILTVIGWTGIVVSVTMLTVLLGCAVVWALE